MGLRVHWTLLDDIHDYLCVFFALRVLKYFRSWPAMLANLPSLAIRSLAICCIISLPAVGHPANHTEHSSSVLQH